VNIAARLEGIAEPGGHLHLIFRVRSSPGQGRRCVRGSGRAEPQEYCPPGPSLCGGLG
jgi:hypothetical protein